MFDQNYKKYTKIYYESIFNEEFNDLIWYDKCQYFII